MPPAADAVQTQADAPAAEAQTPVSQQSAPGRITELRVSANLMQLETGVYCVFPAPGSTPPDPLSGLPGVRITRCPGMGGKPDSATISTFREDGWLDNTAALVRIADGPAQVLVTIYQEAGQPSENAPRLQVLRLSGDPSTAAAVPAPATAAAAQPAPDIMAHVQGTGDVSGGFGDWIGKRGGRVWIEGFGISDKGPIPVGQLEYQGVLGKGWTSPWVDNGKFCGSRGMALPLLGLNLRLKGAAAKSHTLRYHATFVDGSSVGPIEEGKPCEAPGLAALEAFRIELVDKSARTGASDAAPARPASSRAAPPKAPARPVSRR